MPDSDNEKRERRRLQKRGSYLRFRNDPARYQAYRGKQRATYRERVATDPEFREKVRKQGRKAYRRLVSTPEGRDLVRQWVREQYRRDMADPAIRERRRVAGQQRYDRMRDDPERWEARLARQRELYREPTLPDEAVGVLRQREELTAELRDLLAELAGGVEPVWDMDPYPAGTRTSARY